MSKENSIGSKELVTRHVLNGESLPKGMSYGQRRDNKHLLKSSIWDRGKVVGVDLRQPPRGRVFIWHWIMRVKVRDGGLKGRLKQD